MATFLMQDLYNIIGAGSIIVGKVVDGSIRPGMTVDLNGTIATVGTMEAKHQQIPEARTGDMVGIQIKGCDKNVLAGFKGKYIEFSEGLRSSDEHHQPVSTATTITESKGIFGFIR